MFCYHCGNQLPDQSKFCGKCGSAQKQQSEESVSPVPPVVDNSQVANSPSGDSKSLMAVGVGCLIVVAVGGAFFGGRYLSSRSSSQETPPSNVTQSVPSSGAVSGSEGSTASSGTGLEESVTPQRETTQVTMEMQQVDVSNFPDVSVFANVRDQSGNTVNLVETTDFQMVETLGNGTSNTLAIDNVYSLATEQLALNLVFDISSTMGHSQKFQQAQDAVVSFLSYLSEQNKTRVELTMFNDYVYVLQSFTDNVAPMIGMVEGMTSSGNAALFDAAYSAIMQTHHQNGAKLVILFTDGLYDNNSYSYQEVVTLSENTGIPVHFIGIGDQCDQAFLQKFAQDCSGSYFHASSTDLSSQLETVYKNIYLSSQEQYVFRFTSSYTSAKDEFRELVLTSTENSPLIGSATKSYVPEPNTSGAFRSDYSSMSYILPNSNVVSITNEDLVGLSLAQLRIARNEIYARHGRQFLDQNLNAWFYSKDWYLSIFPKYSPTQFDSLSSTKLSSLELQNIQTIVTYENYIMNNELIFPFAENTVLSTYDLTLMKAVLEKALSQLNSMNQTAILAQNRNLITQAIK